MDITNHLKNFSLEAILNSLPQNKSLYRDSGLWQIRTDDMKEVLFQQEINQDFRNFICAYVESFYDSFNERDREDFQLEIASHYSNFAPFEDINNL